jgi:hypothetical protein
METIGAERDGVTEKQAAAELRERLVRFERRATAGKFTNLLLNVLHAIYKSALGEELVQANP